MKFDDMGPGPLPATPKQASDDHPSSTYSHGDRGDAFKRPRPAEAGIVHPDVVEAAIRMLTDQGYRVFKAKNIRTLEASYAVRPAMFDHAEFDHLVRSRVLQDVSINVASSDAVRWNKSDGHYGRLITAEVMVVKQESEL